jgi:hypothetical protein
MTGENGIYKSFVYYQRRVKIGGIKYNNEQLFCEIRKRMGICCLHPKIYEEKEKEEKEKKEEKEEKQEKQKKEEKEEKEEKE